MSKEGPSVYKTPMLTCFSQRQRIQPFNTVLLLLRIARNDFGKFSLQYEPGRHLQIILHLQIKNVIPLTVGGNSSHIKCVVEPSWFSNARTLTIWNVNPQSGPGCYRLNSLHCLLQSINQSINESIIYFNTLRQRAKKYSLKIRTCINKIYNNYGYVVLVYTHSVILVI